jgi:site-specific recombinase XerD
MRLSSCIFQFFHHYLPRIKGSSQNTLKAYRETFSLFVPFAAQRLSIKIDSIKLDHLSVDLILAFLDDLERKRKNTARTRNQRLAAIKSLAIMIRFMYPEKTKLAETILHIPQKRTQKPIIGFLHPEEIEKIFQAVDLKENQGLRDYAILHLLYDSGARASEIASLKLDSFHCQNRTLVILGKANRYRQIRIGLKTAQLIELYISKYRIAAKPLFQQTLFVNQRKEAFTRHGIHRLCKKYLSMVLPPKRLRELTPAHCFRHSCAVHRLACGDPVSDIRNHLGHENVQSTMDYLHLDLTQRKHIQKKFIEYTQSVLTIDPKIDELIDWENKSDVLTWLDSL